MYRLTNLARVAALGAVVTTVACQSENLAIAPTAKTDIFQSYIAIGNSITAGFQSTGINDSTQRQSYARLLALSMGTQYHYASLAGRGCTPPLANVLTSTYVGTGSTGSTCDLRSTNSVTDILNNVAVPGARVLDPISTSTVASNALTTIILGGKTQVQKALEAKPTFASIWIGNNDVLLASVYGVLTPIPQSPGIVSTQAQFQVSYDAMIKQLLDSMPNLRGVLIGVIQVSGNPILSTGDTLFKSAGTKAFINAATGKTVTVDPNCSGSASLVNILLLVQAIRGGLHPPIISCVAGVYPAPVGDIFILDAAEQATLKGVIDGYNSYIAAKAAAIGFAYYDPNPLLASQRATNAIPRLPNFLAANAGTTLFGPLFSLDGIHPAAAGHVLIANGLMAVINAKYGTSLQ